MNNTFKERNILLLILVLLGTSALAGGLALMLFPSGELLNIHLSFLIHSPFNNFLIPGIILFLLFGIFPFILIYALINKPICIIADFYNVFKKMYWAWTFTIYTAIALIIWTQIQILIVAEVYWIQTTITFIAICMIIITLMPQVRNYYKKRKRITNPSDLFDANN